MRAVNPTSMASAANIFQKSGRRQAGQWLVSWGSAVSVMQQPTWRWRASLSDGMGQTCRGMPDSPSPRFDVDGGPNPVYHLSMLRSMVQRLNLSLAAGFGFVVLLAGIAVLTSDRRLEAALVAALVVIAGAASWFLRRAAIRDLEVRAEVEAKLRESEARFSGILAIAANAIITTDNLSRVVHFNRAAEAMFGYPASEIIGAPLTMLLPPAVAAHHHQYVAEFGRSSESARIMGSRREVGGRRRNGEEFPAEVSISKLATADGLLFTAVVHDVTDQRRTAHHEHTLAVAGARLAATLDFDATLRLVAELPVLAAADWCLLDVVDREDEDHPVLRRIASTHSDADGGAARSAAAAPRPGGRALRRQGHLRRDAHRPQRGPGRGRDRRGVRRARSRRSSAST